MRTFTFLTLMILPALGANAQHTLDVLTYNIRFDNPADGEDAWPQRRDFWVGQMRFYKPDIFGIQEGLLHQLTYISEQLPEYERIGVGRDDGKSGGEFSALFFNKKRFKLLESGTFWLSETPETVSKGWDAALPRICTYAHLRDTQTRKNFWVFNTHFDHIGKTARRESAELILKTIHKKNTAGEPLIFMGDLNAEPGEPPVEVLLRELKDTRTISLEPPFGPEGTFNGFKFCEPVTRRIDYIFIKGDDVEVLQQATLSDSRNAHYPSDHLPVLARLRWKR